MYWRLKAHTLAVLSRAPGGMQLYRLVQSLRTPSLPGPDELLTRALDLVALHHEASERPLDGACVEIGTGWYPWVPLLLRLQGARRVVTLDVHPWLTLPTATATVRALEKRLERVASTLGIDASTLRSRLAPSSHARSLREWLDATGIEYRCPTDARAMEMANCSVDAVVSSNVLEHIAPDTLAGIHAETRRVLRPGGVAVHRVNPQDHFSVGDRSITGANFLQFSPDEWRWLGGNGLAYHNRLRCRQHVALVRSAGLSVSLARTRADARARDAIASAALKVHDDFTGMTPEELSDDYLWIAARR